MALSYTRYHENQSTCLHVEVKSAPLSLSLSLSHTHTHTHKCGDFVRLLIVLPRKERKLTR